MRIGNMRPSGNVEDRRGIGGVGGRGIAVGGGVGGLIMLLLYFLMGGNPLNLLGPGGGSSISLPGGAATAEDQAAAEFVSLVLGDTEDVWNELFGAMGKDYAEPRLVLFSGQVESACGMADAAVGPFYCPADAQVYIDLAFFDELSTRFGAPGDFAAAYVIAHEVGHHVQNLLGVTDRVHEMRARMSETEFNDVSVRLELQADYYAGVWAHHAERARQILEAGDIEEGLRAAAAVGDDRLQRQARGYVVPDSFTHGTSEQRMKWFQVGLKNGTIAACNTFAQNAQL